MIKPILIIVLFLIAQISIADEPRTLSTGIGIDQREEAHPDFSAKLVFFVKSSAYLANMNVEIVDNRRKLIAHTTSQGPWLFVNLPAGQYYAIVTRQNGDTQSSYFRVKPGKQTEVALMFPDRD